MYFDYRFILLSEMLNFLLFFIDTFHKATDSTHFHDDKFNHHHGIKFDDNHN
jgi:hypothetical protein